MWVFFSAETNLLEEVAKFRAARRVWATMLKERYGARRPASMQLKMLVFTAGSTFTAQQPLNNVVRATIQSLAATLGGTQTLHCSSYDEAIALPTQEAVTLSLRTQQIIAEESGVANVVDPLAGSYYVESLTDRIEAEIWAEMRRFEEVGGAVAAIESGYSQSLLGKAAYEQQRRIESKDLIVVGVNAHVEPGGSGLEPFVVDEAMQQRAIAMLRELRATRDAARASAALEALRQSARGPDNLVPPIIEAVRAYCTIGEICDALRAELGTYTDPAYLD
jgi:methylmalonyl-CoA mutase N-terminal domain/subunit